MLFSLFLHRNSSVSCFCFTSAYILSLQLLFWILVQIQDTCLLQLLHSCYCPCSFLHSLFLFLTHSKIYSLPIFSYFSFLMWSLNKLSTGLKTSISHVSKNCIVLSVWFGFCCTSASLSNNRSEYSYFKIFTLDVWFYKLFLLHG